METAIIIWAGVATVGFLILAIKVLRSPKDSVDLQSQLDLIIKNQKKMDKTIDEVLISVTENASVDDSIVELLTGIKKQLDDALSGVKLPPAVQAKLNQIFEVSEADKAKVAAAILANTPEQPPVEPPVEE